MCEEDESYINFKYSNGSTVFKNATNVDDIIDHYKTETDDLIQGEIQRNIRSSRKKRFVSRNGRCAVRKSNRFENIHSGVYYMSDIVSALLECRWRITLLWYTMLNLVSWYLFGILWWLIAYAHDDLYSSPNLDLNRPACVSEVRDMINAFMFSVETQYTTGYGSRTPSTECPEAVFLMCVQNIVGMLMQSCSLGIIYAKLARPKARSQAIKFSENAVVSVRDGYLCLMFRIADMRKSHVIGCEVKAWVLRNKLTSEGELLSQYRYRLSLSIDDGGSDTFLVWPVTVVHKIDQSSPLFDVSAEEMLSADFEIVASLICTIQSTGQQVEVRRSYVPLEILWGHRFKNLICKTTGSPYIDYSMFDRTVSVDTALCSAKSLYAYRWPAPPKINLILDSPPNGNSVQHQDDEVFPEEEQLTIVNSIS